MLAVVLVILLFQSTLPRGSDMRELRAVVLATRFQSTLPRGSDLNKTPKSIVTNDFNPRSLAGATG